MTGNRGERVDDNKMTIQSPTNPYNRYNPYKTPYILPPKSIGNTQG